MNEIISKVEINKKPDIKSMIYEIRGIQVMLDNDVAKLYGYEVKVLNQTVKRNANRFPVEFCFQLTEEEYSNLRSQFVTANNDVMRRTLPYVFTEYGVTMLAGLLKSEIAVEISIKIVNEFIEMKKFMMSNAVIFERVMTIENKMDNKFLEHDKKFDEIFNLLQTEIEFNQRIFFEGQIYDAHSLLVDITKEAKQNIIIIDNYIDKTVLDLLINKNNSVNVLIIGKDKLGLSILDINKLNQQYPALTTIYSNDYHDRFIIIDNNIIYHCGASLKDAGKKSFAITRMTDKTLLDKLFIQNII